jgi:catechol 2,3-dioxygenase-like lactoylglutathione lyase family enzyme
MNIDHINIAASEPLLGNLRDFYCRVFGLEEGFRPDFGDHGHWLYSGKRALVHLSESSRHDPGAGQGCLDHVAFQSRDLAGFQAHLEQLGISYDSYFIADIGMTQLFIRDPAGLRIEINFPGES